MIRKLTKEQEAKKEVYIKKWVDLLFDTEIDEEAAIRGAKWLYQLSGLPEPEVMILDSPEACRREATKLGADSLEFSSYGNIFDYGWVAKYEFYNVELGVEYTDDSFFKYMDFIKSGIFDCIQLESVCLISKKPIKVHQDSQFRNHHPTESAIAFRDGYEVFFWKGRRVPPHWILAPEKITTKEVICTTNIELRRCLIDIIGFDRWSSYLSTHKTLIDEQIDNQGHPMFLWQFQFEGRMLKILEVTDPTKLEKYHIWPEQSARDCWEAKGSTFGISAEEMKAVTVET